MNGTHAQTMQTHTSTESTVATGSSLLEASGSLATIALSIVGLAGIFQPSMVGIATVVLGASILTESGIQWSGFNRRAWVSREDEASSKVFAGMAGVVLGILALLGIAPATLTAVAIIVFGGSFFMSGNLLAGVAGLVLGIIAVCGIAPYTLTLVGLLSLGAWALLSGTTVATQALSEKAAS